MKIIEYAPDPLMPCHTMRVISYADHLASLAPLREVWDRDAKARLEILESKRNAGTILPGSEVHFHKILTAIRKVLEGEG